MVAAILYALTLPAVQQRVTDKAQVFLEKKLNTRVEIGAIRVRFPTQILLENFLLEDEKSDTLAQVGHLLVSVRMWKLLDKTIEIKQITLENARVYLHTKDKVGNYDFVVQAFSGDTVGLAAVPVSVDSGTADTTAKPNVSPWKLHLDLAVLSLNNVALLQQNDDSQTTTQANIGTAKTSIAKANLATLAFELDDFTLADTDIRLVQSIKSPPKNKPSPSYIVALKNGNIARTHVLYSTTELSVNATLETAKMDAFQLQSSDNFMGIHSNGIHIKKSTINYRDPEAKPTLGHFNAGDLDLSQLNAEILNFSYQNDTIIVQTNTLSGIDKSGLQVHSLRTTALVTPNRIDVKNTVANFNHTNFVGDILLLKNNSATFDQFNVELKQVKGVFGDLIVILPPPKNPYLSELRAMPYTVSGKLYGTLQNLQTPLLQFSAGNGTIANFSGAVQQVTEPSKMAMQLTINKLESNYDDMSAFVAAQTKAGLPANSPSKLSPQTIKDTTLLPSFFSTSGTLNGTLKSLHLNMQGIIGALQKGDNLAQSLINQWPDQPATQYDIKGVLSEINNPDSLGMDLEIIRLDAPRNFLAIYETNDLQFPDLLEVNGTLRGTLQTLKTDLKFNTLRGVAKSNLAFKGVLKNLQTPENLGFDAGFNGTLARAEILGYVADSLVTKVLFLPDFVSINGAVEGFLQDAAAKASVTLGDFGKLFLDGTLRDSTYLMNLVAQNLRVNQLAVDTTFRPLKAVGFTAKISGNGFQFGKSARLDLIGTFDSLIWDNLILRDITLDAAVNGRKFTSNLQSPDDRAAIRAKLAGDFTTAIPLLDVDIDLRCVDMREFGWVNRPTTVCLHVFSHSEGLSLDTLLANIRIEDIDLQYDTVHIRPGNLAINLKLDNHQNELDMLADWMDGEIKGYFALADLPEILGNVAEQYFMVDRSDTVINKPFVRTKFANSDQQRDSLSLHFHLLKPELITTGLIPGLSDLGVVHLEGTLVAQRNFFDLYFASSRIVYQDWAIDSFKVRSYAGDTAAMFAVTTPLVKRGEKDFIQNAALDGRFFKNEADISFQANDEQGRERFRLGLQAIFNNQSLNQPIKQSSIKLTPLQVIDFKEWAVNPGNEINISAKGIEISQLTMSGDGQSIKIEGATNLLANKKTGLDFSVDIDRLNYGNFDIFVAKTLSDLGGWAEANLKISGTTDAPKVLGNLIMHETFFTPVATNVRYELSETPLEFTNSGVSLGGISLRDPYGKTLIINGKINTTDWADIQTNLTFHADRWQVLNLTKQQNPVYYGELYADLDGTIRGSINQPDLRVVVKTAKASTFTYVYDVATQALQHEGIVYFVQPPRQNVRPPIYDAPVNKAAYTLSASLEIDSNLTISSVINPVTGDDFRGKAIGRLQYDQLANGTTTLSGRVELIRGVYNYSYQSVVKRSFDVTKGSTILWTGDIRTPELDLKARYQFKASPYPLVINQLSSASAEEAASYRKSQIFFLQTTLNGSALQPEVGFQFIYPASERQDNLSMSIGTAQADLVQSALGNVNEDKNQLSRQVFGVLLLQNFIGETVGSINTGGGGNSLQSGLTNFLTGQVNALADQYLKWIDVDLTTTEGSTNNGSNQDDGSTNYQLRLQKSFFEDRLIFKLSGGTSVGGAGSDDVQSALENASVEYALTSNGELKISVFSERGFELLNASSANFRNSGAGLIFSRELRK